MRIRLVTVLVALISLMPGLASGHKADWRKANNPLYNREIQTVTFGGKTYRLGGIRGTAPQTRAASEDDVITKAEGVTKYYNKDTAGTFVFNGEMYQYMETFPGIAVWGEDNTVYIQDILSTMATGTYVKGTVNGNKITCQLGQVLEFYPEEGYGIMLVALETDVQEDEVFFNYTTDITQFDYIVSDNGNLTLSLPGRQFDGEIPPQYVIGICYTDEPDLFMGFSDYTQDWELTDNVIMEIPAGAEVEQYVYVDEYEFATLVDVATVGNSLYIRGLLNVPTPVTLMATIDGNKAYVAQNQCLGIYYDQYFLYTRVLYDNPDFDPNDDESLPFIWAPASATFTLNIDKENKIIEATEDGVYLSFQPDEEDYQNIAMILGKFRLTYQGTAAGTPANPTDLDFVTDRAYYYGYNEFSFVLSNHSTTGTLLDDETLFYKIFIDGEELIFQEEVGIDLLGRETVMYKGVPGQQLYMNSLFNNADDIFIWPPNIYFIGIYVDGVSTIGVQSVYFYDNQLTFSDIVTLDVETGEVTTESGVETVKQSPVIKTEFFDLGGRRVQNPEKGIYVVKQTHADGTTTSTKIMR